MQPFSIRRCSVLAPILLATLLAATAPAQGRARPAVPADVTVMPPKSDEAHSAAPVGMARGVDHSRMYYDTPGDGSLWARGKHYKLSFDGAGATYYPLFSSAQPQHYPLALSPAFVTQGGAPIAFARNAAATRAENRIDLDRGAFIERYELTPDSIEQLFVFDSLPRGGEIVVHVPIAGELDAVNGANGFEFRSPFGLVSYGRAVAIDGRGRRSDAATDLENGSIAIRVDPSFLAGADLPLVIDPVVSTFPIDNSTYNDFLPDIAYDAATDRWLCVFEEQATAGDYDVYFDMCNAAGVPMWGGYVNINNASWNDVECANLASATQFLAVSSVYGSNSLEIRGRTIEADIFGISSEFFISGGEVGGGYKLNPSVGGDLRLGVALPNYFVAYERQDNPPSLDSDILGRFVGPSGYVSAPVDISNLPNTIERYPSVSKSNDGDRWTIAWERQAGSESQIWARRIRYADWMSDTFQVTSGSDDHAPCASTDLSPGYTYLIVYERNIGGNWDIVASVVDEDHVQSEVNLSALEGTWAWQEQRRPSVDSDGQHFLVGYTERYLLSVSDFDIWVSDFFLSGYTLGLAQSHMNLAFTSNYENAVRIASAHGSGGSNRRFMAAWYRYLSAADSDVMGALVDTLEGGPASPFCFGDGSEGACPCGNNGAAGHGCGHSGSAAGAVLSLAGTPSTVDDSAVLTISGAPAVALCIFVQSTNPPSAAVFGDGLGCIGAGMIRLATKTASGGVASYPGFNELPLHTKGGVPIDGGRRAYQTWFRNSANFCTSAAFNITNGMIVDWAR